ncbi:MAG: clan AA aspartic protease, partial [Gammaproteobacteria bacterium]|nr:clan AA aspartic protease [Gammaproteobacteria bacterium]
MGITYANIGVENLFKKRRLAVKSLVDSGSVLFTLPEHIALQLGFDATEVRTREIIPADGSRKSVPMIGPIRVYFADRYCDLS